VGDHRAPAGDGAMRLRALLTWPRAMWLALGSAGLLAMPSLAAKPYCDDALFVARLEGSLASPRAGPFSLYTLAVGGPENQSPFWWTSPALRISFFRPLASALFALDHALFGRAAVPYHVHSILWFLAAVAIVALLLRRLLSERASALAAIVFAVASTHAMVESWPAARHVAIAGAFGFGALLLHIRARDESRPPIAALIVTVTGLLVSEIMLGSLAYVLTYELFGRARSSTTPRVVSRALLPYAVLGALYLVVYRLAHHGVRESGDYADPLQSPLAFVQNIPRHVGPLAFSTFFGVPADASVAFPRLVMPMLVMGGLATIGFGLLLRRALRHAAEEDRRALRWLLPGALLACVPGLGGIVGDRALFVPSFGLAAAFAIAITRGAAPGGDKARAPLLARVGVGALVLSRLVLSPLSLLAQNVAFTTSSRVAAEVVVDADLPREPGARVFGIGIADPLIGMYLQPMLIASGGPRLDVHMLTVSMHDHLVRRVDDRTIEVSISGGSLMESGFETVVRPRSSPLRAGDHVVVATTLIQILEDVEGSPSRFSVTFDRSAFDPSIALVVWKDGRLRRLSPLAIGETIMLQHEKGPVGF
jgi:hypothetical protein